MKSPNINLRVYRRDTNDMTLIYNCLELSQTLKYNPEVTINDKSIIYMIDDNEDKVNDSSRGDVFLFIPYYENNLNDSDKYLVKISFGKDIYLIEVEPKGIFPNLKDNLKMFSQVLGYDNKINKWVKLPLIKNSEKYSLSVSDELNNNVLFEILKELKEINKSIKK